MESTLIVNLKPQRVELIIPIELSAPKPVFHRLIERSRGYIYKGHVAILVKDGFTTIQLRHGSGRGQTRAFDDLVGPEITTLRLMLGRQLRKIYEETGWTAGSIEEQVAKVHVSELDITRIQRAIDKFSADNEPMFWASYRPFLPLGAYTEELWSDRWYDSLDEIKPGLSYEPLENMADLAHAMLVGKSSSPRRLSLEEYLNRRDQFLPHS